MEKSPFDDLEILEREELIARYKNAVGKDPTYRALSNETLISGIRNPEEELGRLAKIDQKSDRDDLYSPYRSKK
ncbi:MAG: hypothetical protein Q8P56_01260 [Candidatus Uhrbacteria bacterium]|nr:hypothetical protein [Candidatus Uhrbacteria bacterium]